MFTFSVLVSICEADCIGLVSGYLGIVTNLPAMGLDWFWLITLTFLYVNGMVA